MAFEFRHESEAWQTLIVEVSRRTVEEAIRVCDGERRRSEEPTRGLVELHTWIEEELETGALRTGRVVI